MAWHGIPHAAFFELGYAHHELTGREDVRNQILGNDARRVLGQGAI